MTSNPQTAKNANEISTTFIGSSFIGLLLAALSGYLATLSLSLPWISLICLAPLFVALRDATWWQAFLYGGITCSIAFGSYVLGFMPFRGGKAFELATTIGGSLIFGFLMMVVVLLWKSRPAWFGIVLFPLSLVVFSFILEMPLGRTINIWALGLTRTPSVLMVGGLGSHLLVVAIVGLASSTLGLAWIERTTLQDAIMPLSIGSGLVAIALIYGAIAYRHLENRISTSPRIRVATVAVDMERAVKGGLNVTQGSDPRANVPAVVAAYRQLVDEGAARGARVIVLPEAHVFLDDTSRTSWLAEVSSWARKHHVYLVAGYIDFGADRNAYYQARNLAVTFGPDGGQLAQYEKQHPVPGLDPKRKSAMSPPAISVPNATLSVAICFDIDFGDITRTVAKRHGIVALPSNDFLEFAEKHHTVARWGALDSRASVLRATTHGISSLLDPLGRELARGSSFDGPVLLVADVPILPDL